MITQFRAKHYKALRDVSLDLTPLHVLIGPNDSGKTSILEAIMALCRSVNHRLADSFLGTWDGPSLVSQGTGSESVVLAAEFSDTAEVLGYELRCSFPATGRQIFATREKVRLKTAEVALDRPPDQRYSFVGGVFVEPSIRQQYVGNDLGQLAAQVHCELAGAQYFRFNASTLSLPVAADSDRRFRMEPDGFGLAICLDNILGHDRAQFGRLEEHFHAVFPQIKAIKLKPQMGWKSPVDDPRMRPQLQQGDGKGLYFAFENGKGDVAAEQMSDGILLVLAYLTILYSPESPRVLLVEEPENGIHPRRLGEVLGILRGIIGKQQQTQVVITTHSPYVVDQFDPQEVTLCQQNEHGEVNLKHLVDSSMVKQQRDVFTLGEIWTAEGDAALAQ